MPPPTPKLVPSPLSPSDAEELLKEYEELEKKLKGDDPLAKSPLEPKEAEELLEEFEEQKGEEIRRMTREVTRGHRVPDPESKAEMARAKIAKTRELERLGRDEYEPKDLRSAAKRAYLRTPPRNILDPKIQKTVAERREEIRKIKSGSLPFQEGYGYWPKREIETPLPSGPATGKVSPSDMWSEGLDLATRGARSIQKAASGEMLMEALGASEEEAGESSKALAKGAGVAAGMKKGMDIAKHPLVPWWAKPLVVAGGAAIGGETGKMAAGETPTLGSASEGFTYGLGYNTLLSQLPNWSIKAKMALGGAEAAAIGEFAKQSKSIIDKGEPLPMNLKAFWDRNMFELLMGVAVGPLIKSPDKAGPPKGYNWREHVTQKQLEEARTSTIDAIQSDILKFQKLQRARTGGKKKAAKKLVGQLKADLKLIEENPDVLFDTKKPEQTARTFTLLRMRKVILDAEDRGLRVNQRAAYDNAVEYLSSLGNEDALTQLTKLGRNKDTPEAIAEAVESLQAAMRKGKPDKKFSIAKVRPGLSLGKLKEEPIKELKRLWNRDWSAIGPSDRPRGKIGKLMSMATGGNFKRFYMGAADVFEEAGRRSGDGKNSGAFRMAQALRNAVDNGDFGSAEGRRLMMQEAENLGFFERANKGKAEQGMREFSAYQEARHSGAMGVEIDPVTGKQIDVRAGIGKGETGHVLIKPGESPDLTRGTVGENLQIDRARKIYNESSLMGKVLIDGFEKASQRIAAKMDKLGVIVIGPGKDGGLVGRVADTSRRYWPRHLKAKYDEALRNLDEVDRHGDLVHAEAIAEMMEALGVKSRAALGKKYKDYLKATEIVSDPKHPQTGELFSHVERMRTALDFPPELLDWSHDLGMSYVVKAERRLAELENFNQPMRLGKEIEGEPGFYSVSDNPDYLFNKTKKLAIGQDSKDYVDAVHRGIFEVSKGFASEVNRGMSGLLIANPLSALRNATGILNTWNVTSNKNFAKALTAQLADEFLGVVESVRGTRKKRPNTALAENIGITSKDIGKITEMIDNQPLSALSGNTDDMVGWLLETGWAGGFSKMERAVRRQGLHSAQFERADFLRLYDENPQAKDLVNVIWDLKFKPNDKRLLATYHDMIGKGGGLKLKLPEQLMENRRLAEHARFLTRLDINMNKVAAERFGNVMGKTVEVPFTPQNAPETTRYLQRFVRDSQGGYRYDQLPPFMSSDMGKIVFKFMNWSQQMTRHFDRNVLSEATNEGNYKPLLKWMAATQIAGEGMSEVKKMFGQDRTDATYAEINAALNEDDYGKAAGMLLVRMGENAYQSGMWALFGDQVGGRIVRYGTKGMVDTPSVVIYDQGELVSDALRRRIEGGDNKRLFEDLVRPISAVHRGFQLATELGVPIPGWKSPERQKYETSQRKMSGLAKRFMKDDPPLEGGLGKEPQKGITGRSLSLGEAYPFKRDLVVALATGDVEGAKKLSEDYVKSQLEARKDANVMIPQYYDKIEKSIRSHQPLKMGNTWSKENQKKVISYMDRYNWPYKDEIIDYQNTYINTAIAAGLLKPEDGDTEVQKKADKSAFYDTVTKAYAQKFLSDREGKSIPQIMMDAEEYYGISEMARLSPPEGTIGSKEGWPFSDEARLNTEEGQILSRKAHGYIGGLLAKRLRSAALGEIMLNPEFLNIGSARGRAEYMVEEWDRRKATQEERNFMLDELADKQFFDSSLLKDLPQYLDKPTMEHYLLLEKRREKQNRRKQMK